MSLQEREQQLQEYLDGTLPDSGKSALLAHVQECAECRAALELASQGDAGLRKVRFPECPDMQARILAAIQKKDASHPETVRWTWFPWGLGFALGLALALFLLLPRGIPLTDPGHPPRGGVIEPRLASASIPAPVPQAFPVMLVKSAGQWSSSVREKSPGVDGMSDFQTGENGSLEFFVCSASRILVLPQTRGRIGQDRVILDNGEMWCEIAHQQPGKYFEIRSDGRSIRVVGTTFGVRVIGQTLEVSLFDGTLQLQLASGPARALQALEKASMSKDRMEIHPIDLATVKTWTSFLSPNLRRRVEQALEPQPAPSFPASVPPPPVVASESEVASMPEAMPIQEDPGKALQENQLED